MKSTLCFTLTFLTFVTLAAVPKSFAQETLPQYVVRQTYFHPSDRPPLPETDARLDRLVKSVQQFYADEMERQGFGRKTFRLETDARGRRVRHYIKGKFPMRDYGSDGRGNADQEVNEYIDKHLGWPEHVFYLNFIELPDEAGLASSQVGGSGSDRYAVIKLLEFHRPTIDLDLRAFNTIAHEIGHAFGLVHDFRDNRYMMSYGPEEVLDRFSFCAVEALDANPFFNTTHRSFDGAPTIEMLPPAFVSPPNTVRLRFKIAHSVRLHQAQVHTNSFSWPGNPSFDPTTLLDCKSLNGNSNTIEFITTQLAPATEYVGLSVIDVHGNATYQRFPLDTDALFPDSEPVLIPDANLAALIRERLGLAPSSPITKLDMLGLGRLENHGAAEPEAFIRDLTGLQHATNLEYLELPQIHPDDEHFNAWGQIRDLTPLTKLTQLKSVWLRGNKISDLRPLAGLTQLTSLNMFDNRINDVRPLAGLTNLTRLLLGNHGGNNNISDITPLVGLTELRVLNLQGNQITDEALTLLTELPKLNQLEIGGNPIHDIAPLAKLTGLGSLGLGWFQITDITPLSGLTKLRSLYLEWNNISDITPLSGLTELQVLTLLDNQIRDVNPLKGLVNLQLLTLSGNPILEKAPLFALLQKNPEVEIWLEGDKPLSLSDEHLDTEPREMYWLAGDNILWATKGGTNRQILVAGLDNGALHIALNDTDGKMYWTTWADVQGAKIQRANLHGSNVEDVVTGLDEPRGIALDVAAGKMYWATWADWSAAKIQRANLDGSNIEDVVTGLEGPGGIALDVAAGKIYWTNYNADKIQRANLDGSNIEDLVTGLGGPGGIALDVAAGKIYWAGFNRIRRANLDGSHVEDLVTGLEAADQIALDVAAGKIYWTDPNTNKIQRANLDGSHVETLFTDQNASGIALRLPFRPDFVTEPTRPKADVNADGTVNITDLVLVASNLGKTGQTEADVNGDGQVNIADLVLVAGALGTAAAAPSLHPDTLAMLTSTDVRLWLSEARHLRHTEATAHRGILFLEQLLAVLIPKETTLLANYPNPFNPETWIPYQLAKDAEVTLTIYAVNGHVVRRLSLGHQPAGVYQNRSRAAYWDGKNAFGEAVASGLYFYTLTAGDFSATRKMLIRK